MILYYYLLLKNGYSNKSAAFEDKRQFVEIKHSDGSQNLSNTSSDQTSSTIYTTVVSNPVKSFSKFTEHQCNAMSMKKEMIKNEFVNTSLLINKAKKAARETDMYLKNLNENVLPRCQSAYKTREIIKRDEVPSIYAEQSQNSLFSFKEQLDNNINKNNEKPIMAKTILKPKSSFLEKYSAYFDNFLDKSCESDYSQQLNNSSVEIPELIKECKKNVGLVSFMAKAPIEKNNNDGKVNNLSVQQIPRLDIKPDLVIQKLANVQIKPCDKNISDYKPNVAYHELTFELEQKTCKCQLLVQPLPMPKIKARSEIRTIICKMLDNMSTNDPLSDQLISQLQKLLINLEKTKSSEYRNFNEIEDLIENHSVVGFDEIVIKNRLLEISEHMIENNHDVISFNQIAVEIENDHRQIINRLDKIKKTILSKNHTMVLPGVSENNKHDLEKYVDENDTDHLKDNSHSKDLYDIRLNTDLRDIGVGDFSRLSSHNITSSNIYKSSIVKEPKIKLCSKKSQTIQNTNISNSISKQYNFDMNNKNNFFHIKKQLPESKNHSQTTLLESVLSSIPLSSHSNRSENTLLVQSEENNENNKVIINDNTNSKYDNGFNKHTGINTKYYEIEKKVIPLECDQSKCQVNENNLNIKHTTINNTIQDYEKYKLNTQKWHLNSSLSSTFNNSQHTDLKLQVLDKETDSYSTCTNSMIALKQTNQEVEDSGSDTGSSISFGEVNNFHRFYKVDSSTSVGEINN